MGGRLPFLLDARKMRRIISFNTTSRLAGMAADAHLPAPLLKAVIAAYAKAFRVNLDEAQRALEEYATMGDFFTRELKPGLRPIAGGEGLLTSPADGTVHNFGPVHNGCIPQVKGQDYSLVNLLQDEEMARQFEGGTYSTIYLSPKDYHRVHSPLAGKIVSCRYIPGALYSVSPIVVNNLANVFTTNERIPIYLKTPHGMVAVVMVGATIVGRVKLSFCDLTTNRANAPEESRTFDPPLRIEKGGELGAFQLGSTVVLLMQGHWEPYQLAEKMPIKMGMPVFER
jgi:phosphatidylserine decarboxylase